MLKSNIIGWSVSWGKRNFIQSQIENAHVYPNNPPVFKRKKDAQFFADVKIAAWKNTGWFTDKDAENVKIVKVKSSVEPV